MLIHRRLTGYFEFLSTHTNRSGRRILSYERSNNSRTGRRTTRANSKSLSGRVNRSKQAARRTRLFEKYFFFFSTHGQTFSTKEKKKREKKIRDSVTTVAAVIGKFDREGKQGGGGNSWRENLVCRPELAITRINFAPA